MYFQNVKTPISREEEIRPLWHPENDPVLRRDSTLVQELEEVDDSGRATGAGIDQIMLVRSVEGLFDLDLLKYVNRDGEPE